MYFYTKVSSANVTPAGRMVYRALLRYANRKTWSCFPSVKTIVNDTGLSERTVRRRTHNKNPKKKRKQWKYI